METTGKIKDISRDFDTRKLIVSILIDDSPVEELQELKGCDALDITARRHRKKRSLNANAYFHLLVNRIAAKTGAGNTEIKNRLIREYGAFWFIDDQIPTVRLKDEYAEAMMAREDMHVKPIGREYRDGCEWVRFAFMRGSHTYDSKEMARLIDGTVSEARELGIETMTPDELERMVAAWKSH